MYLGNVDSWTREYEEIRKKAKFGGLDDLGTALAFEELKAKINAAVNGYFRKEKMYGKAFWISLVATIALFAILGASLSGAAGWVLIIGIVACVCFHKAKEGCWEAIGAARKFDEAAFDGEIFYRRKNG